MGVERYVASLGLVRFHRDAIVFGTYLVFNIRHTVA